MKFIEKLKENVDRVNGIFKKDEAAEPKMTKQEKAKDKRDNQQVSLVRFTYDRYNDEYIWDERTDMKRKDLPKNNVHLTGKKNVYVWTDIWDELTWAKEGQSAIHMYLWMINTKINPDAISEKNRPGMDLDWKKILMYGAIGIVIIIVAWQFLPKG